MSCPPCGERSQNHAAELGKNRLRIATMKRQCLKRLGANCWHAVRLLGYAAILISLWRAPVPWLHRHASPTAATRGDAIEHQRMFHDEPGHACEWHLHIALPDDIAQSGGMPVSPVGQPRYPSNQGFLSGKLCPPVTGGSAVAARLPVRPIKFGLLCEAKSYSLSRHPSHPALPGGQLLTLLCVARC